MHVADTLARSASPRNPNTSRSRCAGSFSMSSHGPSTTNGASCIMHGDVERVIRPSFVRFQRALSALIISPRAGECLGARLFRPKAQMAPLCRSALVHQRRSCPYQIHFRGLVSRLSFAARRIHSESPRSRLKAHTSDFGWRAPEMDVGRRHETNARSGGDSGKSTPFSPPFSTRGRGLARRRTLRRSAGEIVEFQRESRDVRKGGVSPLALAGWARRRSRNVLSRSDASKMRSARVEKKSFYESISVRALSRTRLSSDSLRADINRLGTPACPWA